MSYLFVLLFLPIVGKINPSIKIINTNLIQPDSAILYAGADNIIRIDGLDSTKEYFISSTFGDLSEEAFLTFNKFYLNGNNLHRFDTISVFDNKQKLLFSKIFRVEKLKMPIVQLDNLKAGVISKDSLQIAEFLKIEIPNSVIKQPFYVQSFQIYIQCKKCTTVPYLYNEGAYLQEDFYNYLPFLKSGDKLIIQSVKVKLFDKTTRKLSSVTYVIK